jgi:hypothetical protein
LTEEYGKLVFPVVKNEDENKDAYAFADVRPRPPMSEASAVFFTASKESKYAKQKQVYVWSTRDRFHFGWKLPDGAAAIAMFFRDRMTYCVWGDAQKGLNDEHTKADIEVESKPADDLLEMP